LEGKASLTEYQFTNTLHIMCAPMHRISVNMTSRREILHFHFKKYERIGMEVEMIDGKVINNNNNINK
jgi:hypothetical protein